ncbi:13243_t:CDS:2, partial [Entrophospora sp. SA101]
MRHGASPFPPSPSSSFNSNSNYYNYHLINDPKYFSDISSSLSPKEKYHYKLSGPTPPLTPPRQDRCITTKRRKRNNSSSSLSSNSSSSSSSALPSPLLMKNSNGNMINLLNNNDDYNRAIDDNGDASTLQDLPMFRLKANSTADQQKQTNATIATVNDERKSSLSYSDDALCEISNNHSNNNTSLLTSKRKYPCSFPNCGKSFTTSTIMVSQDIKKMNYLHQ